MEKECRIIIPREEYKRSYLAALLEYHREGRNLEQDINIIEQNFSLFIKSFSDESKGIGLVGTRVPQTTYWLVDDSEYIGRVSLRHTLNDNLRNVGGHIGYDIRPSMRGKGFGTEALRLVLPKAKELGIQKVLLTCDSTNIASKKIIESCGGIFEK